MFYFKYPTENVRKSEVDSFFQSKPGMDTSSSVFQV